MFVRFGLVRKSDDDFSNISQKSLSAKIHRPDKEVNERTLLSADLEDFLVFLVRTANDGSFLDSKRQRFLTENVLSCHQGFHRDLHVPVIRRRAGHHVDVVPIQDPAVVSVTVFRRDIEFICRTVKMSLIDVAHSRQLTIPGVSVGIPVAHASYADAPDANAVRRRVFASRTGKECRDTQNRCQRKSRNR